MRSTQISINLKPTRRRGRPGVRDEAMCRKRLHAKAKAMGGTIKAVELSTAYDMERSEYLHRLDALVLL